MIVVVTGGRNFKDYDAIAAALNAVHSAYPITELVEGEASGVDLLCRKWAESVGIKVRPMPADWKNVDVPGAVVKHNKYGAYNAVAGHLRNQAMLETLPKPTYGIVFPGGSGTADMHRRMQAAGLSVYVPY